MQTTKTKLTPPELAKLWGVAPEKIVFWIKSGELPAIDASRVRGARPRYLIDEDAIAEFEARRQVTPPLPQPKRRRKSGAIVRHFR
jgi:hypothetical protein